MFGASGYLGHGAVLKGIRAVSDVQGGFENFKMGFEWSW
jgi:hypothetical protein